MASAGVRPAAMLSLKPLPNSWTKSGEMVAPLRPAFSAIATSWLA